MPALGLPTQSGGGDSTPLSPQRLVNCYCELRNAKTKWPAPIFGCPGIAKWKTLGTGPIRGGFQMRDVGYFVSGDELHSINNQGTFNKHLCGTGITGGGPVSMAGNGTQVIITNGTNGWIYTVATDDFAAISDGDFIAGKTVCFLDGYFILDEPGTNKFTISALLDGTSFDPLAFASAESDPDNVLAVRNRKSVLIVFGAKTIEFWDHTGALNFPFQRYKGTTIDRGVAGSYAIAAEDESVFFLGEDSVFYRLQGASLQRISTHDIEQEWAKYSTVEDAICFVVPYAGHKWITITFPTAGKTWATDIGGRFLWHERTSFDASGLEVKWRAACVVPINNTIMVGDANSNKVGLLDPTTYTEFGDTVLMTVVTPTIHAEGAAMSFPMLEVDMDAGVGLTRGQGADPQIMLDISDDGGRTYTGPQLWQTMGAIGTYQTRVTWFRLGTSRERVFKFTISDPVQRVMKGARVRGVTVAD